MLLSTEHAMGWCIANHVSVAAITDEHCGHYAAASGCRIIHYVVPVVAVVLAGQRQLLRHSHAAYKRDTSQFSRISSYCSVLPPCPAAQQIDQAALTGESLPAKKFAGDVAFSGSTIKQGEKHALVYATGQQTFFGRAASLLAVRIPPCLQTCLLLLGPEEYQRKPMLSMFMCFAPSSCD